MENRKWFLLPLLLIFGSYLLLDVLCRQAGYYLEWLILSPFAYTVACLIAFAVLRGRNRMLAKGCIWGLAAVFVYLFTFGGCGSWLIF